MMSYKMTDQSRWTELSTTLHHQGDGHPTQGAAHHLRVDEDRSASRTEAALPVLKLTSGNHLDVSPPPSKRFRSSEDECDRDSGVVSSHRSPPKVLEDIDASNGQESEDSFIDSDKLEIRVPRTIRTVTLMRGSRRLTVSLE